MFLDVDLDGTLDLAVANGHIDETVRNIRGNTGYAQSAATLFESRRGKISGRPQQRSEEGSRLRKLDGDGLRRFFDRDGDLDMLMTTNNGPAYLYRNDQEGHPRSIRFRLQGTKSNRDAIRASSDPMILLRGAHAIVRNGPELELSFSIRLPVTFGLGLREKIDRVVMRLAHRIAIRLRTLQAKSNAPRMPLLIVPV